MLRSTLFFRPATPFVILLPFSVFAAGCTAMGGGVPGALDSAVVDGPAGDTATTAPTDGSAVDDKIMDGSMIDLSMIDASMIDASMIDASIIDARLADLHPLDSSLVDIATVDAIRVDAGPVDMSKVDIGANDLSVPPKGPAPVLLGASGNFVILAKTEVSTVPTSAVTGDVGLSPAAASFITGFSLTRAGTYSTSPQVTGKVYAADNDPPTPTNLTTAVLNMQTAYTDAAGRPTPDFLNLGAGAIGGLTLSPGLYKWTSTVTIPTDVTLSGSTNDVWIFQVSGDLTVSGAAKVKLVGGAMAKKVFWQVAGVTTLGSTSHFEGIALDQTAIVLKTSASVTGRLLAQSAVTLQSNAVTQPAP